MINKDLTIKGLMMGTHETAWDLKVLLYKNATSVRRDKVMKRIDNGDFGNILPERATLVIKLYDMLMGLLISGSSHRTIKTYLEQVWKFFAAIDKNNLPCTEEEIVSSFKIWTEYLLTRVNQKKDLSHFTAYKTASMIANIIAKTLSLPGSKPGHSLMLNTRLSRPNKNKPVLGTQSDKQNLANTFQFGRILTTMCQSLDLATVRGPVPIKIKLSEEQVVTIAGNLIDPDLDVSTIENPAVKRTAILARQALPEGVSLFEVNKRSNILNLRIEAELLVFLAQTGMNLAQAVLLKSEDYRWQTNGEDYDVFRVYKGRRQGESIFSCYNTYREHLQNYLKWLNDTGLKSLDDRLFPLLSRGMVRSTASRTTLSSVKKLFKKNDLIFINPSELRNTRVNWLIRHTDDISLTASQMGHTADVLVRDYLRPHHQRATNEIINFHDNYDPSLAAPGPGVCVGQAHPQSISQASKDAPIPDCISPEGCIFCTHHKDIMSYDYCWKLASHLKIKKIELGEYKPSNKNYTHPACLVIDRLNLKLEAIAKSSSIRDQWVVDARDSIRAGNYHPQWSGFINLLEEMK